VRRTDEGETMDQLATLGYALDRLRGVVVTLDDSQLDTVTNCEPWTARQLASHALNNQLLWAGIVTGQEIVSAADTMGAVPYEGDLALFAEDATARAMAMWRTAGVMEAMHVTVFGELPGSVVVNFPTIDALAHSWDLSASVGRPIEFEPQAIGSISAVVEATCTDAARASGVIQAATQPPADATDTELLMASAGRTIPR
jgi:uncharacterized protein (TIGR03086 family)